MARALRRGIIEVPNSSEAHAALAQLNARLARIESARDISPKEAIDDTARALFIGYGTAILSAPGEPTPTSDGAEEILEYAELHQSLKYFCEWLKLLKVTPRRIFSLEDLDSQIIARALAEQLSVEWNVAEGGDGFTHSKSLIVSANSCSLVAPPLRTIFPAQVVYTFNLQHGGGAIMPDVSGISRADTLWPWQEERLSPRKITDVVNRILSEPSIPTPAALISRLEFYRARRGLLSAGNSCFSRLSILPESL